ITYIIKIKHHENVRKEGGTVKINDTSNSTKLTFSLTPDETHPLTLEIPASYQAAGKATNNGAVIADDPGATGSFAFSIVFSDIAANTDVYDLVNTIKVKDACGQTAKSYITKYAGILYLE